jgi:hypothetical protein
MRSARPQPPSAPTPCRTFGEYVSALVSRLAELEPALARRLREVVGDRRARLVLDEEAIEVHFAAGNLVVTAAGDGVVDGEGITDRDTTLEILAGRLEVTTALLEGRIQASGEIENLVRIFQAIELLLDGACRNPALQKLSLDYEGDPCRARLAPGSRFPAARRVSLDPDRLPAGERAMLARLDLLP